MRSRLRALWIQLQRTMTRGNSVVTTKRPWKSRAGAFCALEPAQLSGGGHSTAADHDFDGRAAAVPGRAQESSALSVSVPPFPGRTNQLFVDGYAPTKLPEEMKALLAALDVPVHGCDPEARIVGGTR